VISLAGIATAIVMTRRWARAPIVAPIAAGAAAVASGLAFAWWWSLGAAVIAATIALVGRSLRRERVLIRAEDPAAGSEVFTLRGVARRIRAAAKATRAWLGRRSRKVTAAIAIAPVVAIVGYAISTRGSNAPKTPAVSLGLSDVARELSELPKPPKLTHRTVPTDIDTSSYHIEACGYWEACWRLSITFHGSKIVEVPSLFPGLSAVPAGWHASIDVTLDDDNLDFTHVLVDVFPSNDVYRHGLAVSSSARGAHFDTNACNSVVATNARFSPPEDLLGDHVVTFVLRPRLELGKCAEWPTTPPP
jgi:hypothetical protein